MTDKVKIHIPVNTPEQIVIRDEIAKKLAKDAEAVILSFEEVIQEIDGEYGLFPISVVEVYISNLTKQDLNYFKRLTRTIAQKVGSPVVLEVVTKVTYIGTAFND